MAYLHNLPGYKELEKQFVKKGYSVTVDLSNDLVIKKDGEWVEYDELPDDLKQVCDEFAELNKLFNF